MSTEQLTIAVWCWGDYPSEGLGDLMRRCARHFPSHALLVLTEPERMESMARKVHAIRAAMTNDCRDMRRSQRYSVYGVPLGRLWIIPDPAKHGLSVSFPPCYVRLWCWSAGFAEMLQAAQLPPRVLQLDMDTVPVADCSALIEAPYAQHPYVLMSGACHPEGDRWHRQLSTYSGGMVLLTPGEAPDLWARFVGELNATGKPSNRFPGSDQQIISNYLGRGRPTWAPSAGIWRSRELPRARPARMSDPHTRLPRDARIVHFTAHCQPWTPKAQALHPWLLSA